MAAAALGAAAAVTIRALGAGTEPAARQRQVPPDLEDIIRRGQDRLKALGAWAVSTAAFSW